jgi:hypothetical protein
MAWTVVVDGSNITPLCQNINWHPRWSRPATCVVTFPGHLFSAAPGARMLLYNNANLVFAGPVWHREATGGPNRTDCELTAYDDLIYMTKRLCKQGEFDPSPFNLIEIWPTIDSWFDAPEIMAAFVQSALDDPKAATPPSASLPWVIGSVEYSNVDVTGMPMNTPMTLDQMRQLLQSTGQLAINVNPGVSESILDFVVPPTSASGSVTSFDYQTGAFNSQNANVNDDMDVLVNALWYLLGPRGPRPGIKINHWGGSITPTAANAGGDGEGGIPGTPWPPTLITKFLGSRQQYGYFQEIRIFDEHQDAQSIRELYEEQWANEAWLRAYPRRFVNVTPERGVDPAFTVGNFVTMSAGSRLSGGFSGQAIVFEFEVQINVNGVVAITEIIASDDGSGATSVGG